MKIVGCDFHPSLQQVAVSDISTGEVKELKLMHGDGEADGSIASWSRRRWSVWRLWDSCGSNG